MAYIIGEEVEMFGSLYKVDNVYQLSNEFMEEHNLQHRNRVTLIKLSGENGTDRMDFAIVS